MLARLLVGIVLLQTPQPAAGGPPVVYRVEPDTLPAYAPVTLTVRGEGFTPSCRVRLGAPGKLVQVTAILIGPDAIEVRLPLGLSPARPERVLVVECGSGLTSAPFRIRVDRAPPPATPAPDPRGASGEPPAGASAPAAPTSHEAPVIEQVDPAELETGQPVTLTVKGHGFSTGALVRILANVNAGTSSSPRYEMKAFAAEVLSPTVLTVTLDRAFAPMPRQRALTVVSPDGAESAPVFLAVARRVP
jgi:hypothetical protein